MTPSSNGYFQAETAADWIRSTVRQQPIVGILTGTGLGDIAADLDSPNTFPYQDIPHFPLSTVEGHAGRLALGLLSDTPVVVFQGRFHLYEGYSPAQVSFPIRVLQALGVKYLIITNAAGGLNLEFATGDLMLIRDHINLTGVNPLTGPNDDRWGLRFPDMTEVYSSDLLQLAKRAAEQSELSLREGIYVGLPGPSLETPAETRFLRTIGADAVGFSTIQEVIAAVHAGMKILGISAITNINDPDHPAPTRLEDVMAAAGQIALRMKPLIAGIVENLHVTL